MHVKIHCTRSIADKCPSHLLAQLSLYGDAYRTRKQAAGTYEKAGVVNKYPYWLKGNKAIWFDTNRNWCLGPKNLLGKAICDFWSPGTGSLSVPGSLADCPNGLKWFKIGRNGWKEAGNDVKVLGL